MNPIGPKDAAVDTSIDGDEIARFAALAEEWWDPDGPFRPLHQLNPARIGFLRDRLCAHFGRDPLAPKPLEGLSIIDVGCGGGLVCEPLCRLGATVTGIDAAAKNIGIAVSHAESSGLDITYLATSVEALAETGKTFDAVLTLEVIEHVADREIFMAGLRRLVASPGVTILSTLNRTMKSYAFAIVGAEYVMGWLPHGTHDWKKFLRPSELTAGLTAAGFGVTDLVGLSFDLLKGEWRTGRDLSVNYFAVATPD